MMKIKWRLSLLLMAFVCSVGAGILKVPDCAIEFEKGKEALTVRAVAPAGYHFNRKAPTELSISGTSTKFKPTRFENQKLEFLVSTKESLRPGTKFMARLYICDVKETFCVPQQLEFAWR